MAQRATPYGRFDHWFDEEVVQPMADFQNPRQEWRRLFSELFGTFFLVLVAAGGGMMGQAFPGTISRTAAVVAPGLMVMAIILFMGKVSGAHLNPAVSLAFALRGDFPWRRVPGYIVVQLVGAALAAWFLQSVIHVSASFGSNYPASGYSSFDAFLMEAILTLGLVSVIRRWPPPLRRTPSLPAAIPWTSRPCKSFSYGIRPPSTRWSRLTRQPSGRI
jgi:aquaporin Z